MESRVLQRWEEAGVFHPEPEGTAEENFSIAVPPPNVTGALHMGHALNGSIQDVCSASRACAAGAPSGSSAPTTPGIATQVKVEQQLVEEGTSREEIGREAFVERVWEWREQYGSRSPSSSAAWARRWTSRTSASRWTSTTRARWRRCSCALYEKGLIYRDNYMVNWDPGTGSAISDLEVEQRWVEDTLY